MNNSVCIENRKMGEVRKPRTSALWSSSARSDKEFQGRVECEYENQVWKAQGTFCSESLSHSVSLRLWAVRAGDAEYGGCDPSDCLDQVRFRMQYAILRPWLIQQANPYHSFTKSIIISDDQQSVHQRLCNSFTRSYTHECLAS